MNERYMDILTYLDSTGGYCFSFLITKCMKQVVQKYQGEKLLWSGGPMPKPFILNRILDYFKSTWFIVIFIGISYFGSLLAKSEYSWDLTISFFALLLIIELFILFYFIIEIKKIKYRITDHAVYIKKGVIDSSLKIIEKHKSDLLISEPPGLKKNIVPEQLYLIQERPGKRTVANKKYSIIWRQLKILRQL